MNPNKAKRNGKFIGQRNVKILPFDLNTARCGLDKVIETIGKANIISVEKNEDKPTYTCPHCGETLEQGDDVYIDCFDGSRIRVTVTEIGEGIIVGVDAEGKSHWGNPKDVTKITEQ